MNKVIISIFFTLTSVFSLAQGHSCKEDLFPMKEKNRMYGYVNILGDWKVNPIFTRTFPFHGKTAIVQQGLKFGAISCEGKVIIQPIYDEIKPFKVGVSWVRVKDKWGLVSDDGKVLLEAIFFEIKEVSRFSAMTWIKQGLVWGLYNIQKREFVYEPQFDGVQALNDNISLVKKEGKSGFINNQNGEYLIKPTYRTVLKIAPYIMTVEEGGKWGVINDNGQKVLPVVYDTIKKVKPNRLLLKSNNKYALASFHGKKITKGFYDDIQEFKGGAFRVKRKGKYGFINLKGRVVIPLVYDTATYYKNRTCIVKKGKEYFIISTKNRKLTKQTYQKIKRSENQNYFVAKNDTGWAFLDLYAQKNDASYFEEIKNEDNSARVRVKKNEKWGYYNSQTEKMIIPAEYTILTKYNRGFTFGLKNNLWGALDSDGNTRIPHEYESIVTDSLNNQMIFEVQKNGNYGIINIKNRIILPLEYQKLRIIDSKKLMAAQKNKSFLIDQQGNVLSKKYNEIDLVSQDTLAPIYPLVVTKKHKKAFLSANGELLFKPIYEEIQWLAKNLYKVKVDGKWGLIDNKGNIKVSFLYNDLTQYDELFIIAQKNGKWGYINEKGVERIKFVYNQVKPFKGQVACVQKNGKWGVIDKRGKEVIPCEYEILLEKNHKRYLFKGDYKVFIKSNGVIQR